MHRLAGRAPLVNSRTFTPCIVPCVPCVCVARPTADLCPSQRSARWMTATDLSSSNESSAAGRDVFVYQLSYAPSTLALIGYVIYWAMWCENLVP